MQDFDFLFLVCTFDCFKTKTTLCVPSLIFNHHTKHTFTLATNTPINSAFMGNGCGDNAIQEIEFELWKRHYYPNVREELIGKVRHGTSVIDLMI